MPKNEREPGIREVFLLRERARKLLRDFLAGIAPWPTRREFPHFRPNDEKDAKETAHVRPAIHGRRKLDLESTVGVQADWDRDQEGITPERSSKYLDAFFRLLAGSVAGTPPSRMDLDILLDALNQNLTLMLWSKDGILVYSAGIRGCAEHLVDYLNLIPECGPVHNVCGDCGCMFVRGLGDRKFCHACSKNHQTYQYRKDYLLRKKREYYQRQVEGEREFRKIQATKGAHGKAKRKK